MALTANPSDAELRRATAAKTTPPLSPPWLLDRIALRRRLDDCMNRRLTVVLAEAGFGKSSLLADWASTNRCAWYTLDPRDATLTSLFRGIVDALRLRVPGLPGDLATAIERAGGPDLDREDVRAHGCASLLADALQDTLQRDLALVLDDVQEATAGSGAVALIEALSRQAPPRLHVVLSSRAEPPFAIDRMRGQGQVLEIFATDLAFSEENIAELLAQSHEPVPPELPAALLELTGGWPVAVRLAIEGLSGSPPSESGLALDRFGTARRPLFSYLASEVFEREPPEIRRMLRVIAAFDWVTADLCEALGISGAGRTLESLQVRGLFLESGVNEPGALRLSTLARDFLKSQRLLDDGEARGLQLAASEWFEARGHLEEALVSLHRAGDVARIAQLLRSHGPAMIRNGLVEPVVRAAEALPADLRGQEVEQLLGEAQQVLGHWEAALKSFRRVAGPRGELDAGLAWRMGLIHHLRGELDLALEVYGRGRIDGRDRRDEALLLAWTGAAHWILGNRDECRTTIGAALEAAVEADDPRALAAAHTGRAMLAALDGDRSANDHHYLRALRFAEEAQDVLQIVRIRTNRGSHFLEEGSYEEGIAELDIAIRLAEVAGYAAFHALALNNRGEAKFYLGRFEDAISDLEGAKSIYERIGKHSVCTSLQTLGQVYRERGEYSLARAALEEAISEAELSGDMQNLVPALAGLSLVLLEGDVKEAEEPARRAVAFGPTMAYVKALLAAGWGALRSGDRAAANDLAVRAGTEARQRRDRPGIAEALELEALSSEVPALETARLEEAVSIWRDVHNPVGKARAELFLAGLVGGSAGRALAEEAEGRLHAIGARGTQRFVARLVASPKSGRPVRVAIRSLGGFQVLQEGRPVVVGAWQSKKARDLLKILVARRGHPVTRDSLIESLWPGEDSTRLGNRLSVALSTLRQVLDPRRTRPSEHFVNADKSTVALDLQQVEVDLEDFLAEATEGLALRRAGRVEEGRTRLEYAEAVYGGDFLEDDPYEDWAVGTREEAKATYLAVARALGDDAARAGDADAAARFYLRLLEHDPYDEGVHLGLVRVLVAVGRHGEARRHYRTYASRMQEIEVEAAPFPAPAR